VIKAIAENSAAKARRRLTRVIVISRPKLSLRR
jgi:hypothetical protein